MSENKVALLRASNLKYALIKDLTYRSSENSAIRSLEDLSRQNLLVSVRKSKNSAVRSLKQVACGPSGSGDDGRGTGPSHNNRGLRGQGLHGKRSRGHKSRPGNAHNSCIVLNP